MVDEVLAEQEESRPSVYREVERLKREYLGEPSAA
jgi:hypothetical protein